MMVLGIALGAVQFLPLYELVRQSFREGSASLQQVRDWAWPIAADHHLPAARLLRQPHPPRYFDIWQRAWVPVTQNAWASR